MRELYNEGKLNELQSRFYQPTRPVEELYDLEKDPFEINNLAEDPKYAKKLKTMRLQLYAWMDNTNDVGIIPEPILEDMGKKYGNKYTAMKQPEYANIHKRLILVIEAGEKQEINYLLKSAGSDEPAERYWAVTWLGVNKVPSTLDKVKAMTEDKDPAVRIAANLALYKIDPTYDPLPELGKLAENRNLIAGMYAMSAIEQTGIRTDAVKAIAKKATESPYDFTQRYGKYLMNAE